jgi:hypothetical protein
MLRRAQQDVTWREQQRAFDMLLRAGQLHIAAGSKLATRARQQEEGEALASVSLTPLPGFPEIEVAEDAHPGAVRELAKALQVRMRVQRGRARMQYGCV